MLEYDLIELHPLKQQKIAQKMCIEKRGQTILFTLITPIRVVECEWLDPHMGLFAIKGMKEKGFLMIKDLPEGSMITGQRYGDKDGN